MDSKKETAPGGQDQEQFVSKIGNTAVIQTKESIWGIVKCGN